MAFSLADPAQQDRHPSPGLTINLPSNNPFRNPNRAVSPSLSPHMHSPQSLPGLSPRIRSPQPTPTNPFLAQHEQLVQPQIQVVQPPEDAAPFAMASQPSAHPEHRGGADNDAAQLFHRLTLADNGAPAGAPTTKAPIPHAMNGLSYHKSSRSDEAERRRDARTKSRPRPDTGKQELDIFASPDRQSRPRRNSESSAMSKTSLNEDERRRRERRRRGDERRLSKERDSSKPRTARRRPRGMDLIDQLDQTGIYGSGYIHHDGPFDAVNPHRNRRRDDRAPMRAFPKGSANMVMGGSGPVNKALDVDRIHGNTPQGFTDYAAAAPAPDGKVKALPATVDPLARVDPVHGEESYGLGTSTFLEGAPASRTAIQRRESETKVEAVPGGLQRKKSLAQRIRGMSRREYGDDRPYIRGYDDVEGGGAVSPAGPFVSGRMVQSAGGPYQQNESNPFDNMYDDAFDKKGAAIRVAEQNRVEGETSGPSQNAERGFGGRVRAPSSPNRNLLERRVTTDSAEDRESKPSSTGILGRMKSLKGPRRARGAS